MDLVELFGEATLKTLALATAEDATNHLRAGHPLRAAFSAAHHVQLSGRPGWTPAEQARMSDALVYEVKRRLRAGDGAAAAWRADYLKMLTGEAPWSEDERARLIAAVAPRQGVRHWSRMGFAGQAADYYLLSGEAFWSASELEEMLRAVHDDFSVRLRNGDRLMAADRVVLYKALAGSLEKENR